MFNQRKVGIIGAGHVGSHCGLSLIVQGVCDEIVFVDSDGAKAQSQAFDCMDTMAFLPHRVRVKKGEVKDLATMDIIVISVGTIDNVSKNRLSELEGSLNMIKSFVPEIMKNGFKGYFVVITNPVDVVTYFVQKLSGLPHHQVIGTGTGLDSARLRRALSTKLNVDAKSIQAYMLGEHGDSQMGVFSQATVNGMNLKKFLEVTDKKLDFNEVENIVAKAGWDIYSGKKSTEFGIACVCTDIVRAIYSNEKKIMACSGYLNGQYGENGIYIGVPTIVGKYGVEKVLELELNSEEQKKFNKTIEIIKKHIEIGNEILKEELCINF
ncbi:L-lactate dehydrogenase [Candidatus Cetobacterium colombiensis]|uniref:L-lactate dehydrogenase n=1 Tax=Candidatus Cetobacterium colombiensis TaxID=3073100 RepID=A0ABU4W9H1_9FUSO|nr:L-lactate dehydrogenase [Candidatus Cetobacterium colombiensis]MDX8336163.1 L-lactate dehydrogenase [Candidatus Cetobacterium colombiensis]